MTKFHINKHGVPAPCHAKDGNCPLGNGSQHFDTIEHAQRYADKQAESEHSLLPNATNISTKDTKGLSNEWYERIASYKVFDELINYHASEMVQDELVDVQGDVYGKSMNIWKDVHYQESLSSISELSEQEAIDIVRDNVDSRSISGWFREYDSDYKPKIEHALITDPAVRNASMNIAHRVYQESTGKQIPYDDFVNSEIEVYRGGNFDFIDNDVFISYSFDKKVAEKFANGGEVYSERVFVADTLGSLQTTGEAELMVRNRVSYE